VQPVDLEELGFARVAEALVEAGLVAGAFVSSFGQESVRTLMLEQVASEQVAAEFAVGQDPGLTAETAE
jgi:hypothetical protein